MKRLLLLAAICVSVFAHAQDYKKVQTMALLRKYEEAKTELDKINANPAFQAKAETWFWKLFLYNSFAKDDKLKVKYPTAVDDAEAAFVKYRELEPSLKLMKDNNGSDILFTLYGKERTVGNDAFSAKKYETSAASFAKAVDYIDIIVANKFTNANIAFDTSMIFFAGYSYQQDKKEEMAYKFYKRLADNKIAGTDDYKIIYNFMLIYDIKNKNREAFDKYLKTAKEVFPKDNWNEYEAEYIDKNFSLQDKSDYYDKQDAAGTLTAVQYIEFGSSFYNLSKEDKDKLDSAKIVAYHTKAREAFKKAYAKDNTQFLAAFNTGLLYYLDYDALDEKIRANIKVLRDLNTQKENEKDPKKKAALDAKNKPQIDALKAANLALDKQADELSSSSLEWYEKAYTIIKDKPNKTSGDKNFINRTVDYLANLYSYKRDKAKGKDQKAFDAYDAKFKLYDSLHQ